MAEIRTEGAELIADDGFAGEIATCCPVLQLSCNKNGNFAKTDYSLKMVGITVGGAELIANDEFASKIAIYCHILQ